MFRVERFAATHAHRLVYRRWEIVYTTVDLLAAICFASSRDTSRPRRGCQTSRVRPISSSL